MAKKRKVNYFKLILLVVSTLLIVVGIVLAIIKISSKNLDKHDNIVEHNTEAKPENEEKIYTAKMIMAGDALIHSSVYKDAYRLGNNQEYDFKPQIEYIKSKVKDYDIAYYNQETILGGTTIGVSDYPTFNSPTEIGDAMIDAGFNLVSLATNHTMDRGKKAIESARNYWNNQVNVQAVGSYTSMEEKNKIESKILEVNNIKYAMLSYTYGTNGIPVKEDYLVNVWPTNLGINDPERDTEYQNYKEVVKKDIEALRNKVDVLFVAMHWGVEYTHVPTAYEKDMANFLAEQGVDVVIGSHPHVIQPVEWIDDTLVIYSLGNFISAQYQDKGSCKDYKCMVGLMPSLTITKKVTGNNKEIIIDNIENDLLYTYYSNWRNFKVIPFSSKEIEKYLPNYQRVYDKYSKIIASDDERITTLSPAIN